MLVLSRKVGEKLIIGDNIVLTLNKISGNRVAIGIEAPREVSIVRGELQKAILAESGDSNCGRSLEEMSGVSIASMPDC
ncbi:carbon storage regulator [Crateriforma conspicua]|uniref:Translational regulator CsrA n=1 Tax=Crateriforma conspicua TaxID=2527996 RepID=A0A5C5XYC3_9PLAN|nr:carbon storage regulator [Crateriforma conspicua]QDV63259.1 Carbon storage regulator [Crateriforma conspicua]TWT67970.1 Carbon storage regulator [Crateriforma conspicua]